MARAATKGEGKALPLPSPPLALTTLTWPAEQVIHRIHLDRYGPAQFNPGSRGNARFSPIVNAKGGSIPTLYGGSTFDCAAMETIFHDVPFAAGLKTIDKVKLVHQLHSVLKPEISLKLVDLRNVALRKLGVTRRQLIDSEKDCYPLTRQWAQALHAQDATVEGLCWTSRQDDSARAVMLFGDRLAPAVFRIAHASRSILGDEGAYDEVLSLANRIGLSIVGKLP